MGLFHPSLWDTDSSTVINNLHANLSTCTVFKERLQLGSCENNTRNSNNNIIIHEGTKRSVYNLNLVTVTDLVFVSIKSLEQHVSKYNDNDHSVSDICATM